MRAIFLDRDGVISENRNDHVKSWNEFRFIPGALDALARLHQAGFPIFIVTNQAIVNRGIISAHILEDIHARMLGHVVQHGGFINDIHYCPHDYSENCHCRKPRPGMLIDLAARWQIDLADSYFIGDAWTDIAAGQAANCRTIMVRTGRGAEQSMRPESYLYPPDHIAADLLHSVEWIFDREGMALSYQEHNISSQLTAGGSLNLAFPVGG